MARKTLHDQHAQAGSLAQRALNVFHSVADELRRAADVHRQVADAAQAQVDEHVALRDSANAAADEAARQAEAVASLVK
jgi:hypothetical protein